MVNQQRALHIISAVVGIRAICTVSLFFYLLLSQNNDPDRDAHHLSLYNPMHNDFRG